LIVTLKNENTSPTVTLNRSHMYKDAIDSASWTRVRIPLSELGVTVTRTISKLSFQLVDQSNSRVFYLDEVRFTYAGTLP
jgi:hypothetical protein